MFRYGSVSGGPLKVVESLYWIRETKKIQLGCETEPKRTLQTGVNEILTVSDQPVSATDMQKRRRKDMEP